MITFLHSAVFIASVFVIQAYPDQEKVYALLTLGWGFILWQYFLGLYAHTRFLANPEAQGKRRSLPHRLLGQAHKKRIFRSGIKSLRVWDYKLIIWCILGAISLLLIYNGFPDKPVNEGLPQIEQFFEAYSEAATPGVFYSKTDRLMALLFPVMLGISFLTALLRANQNRKERFFYWLCTALLILQLGYIAFQTGDFNWFAARAHPLGAFDWCLIAMGGMTAIALFRGAMRKPYHRRKFALGFCLLLFMFVLFLYAADLGGAQGVYFMIWAMLGSVWGKKQDLNERKLHMRQI